MGDSDVFNMRNQCSFCDINPKKRFDLRDREEKPFSPSLRYLLMKLLPYFILCTLPIYRNSFIFYIFSCFYLFFLLSSSPSLVSIFFWFFSCVFLSVLIEILSRKPF